MKSDADRIAELLDQAAGHRRRNRWVDELHALDRVLNIRGDQGEAHLLRAEVLLKLRVLDEAIASADRSLALDPAEPRAWYAKGLALAQSSRPEQALSAFEAALAIDPGMIVAIEDKALALAELGRMDDAAAAGEAAVRLNPKAVRPYLVLANLHGFAADGAHLPAMEALAKDDAGLPSAPGPISTSPWAAPTRPPGTTGAHSRASPERAGYAIANDYDEPGSLGEFERSARSFSADVVRRASGAGDPSRAPIFVLAMPRSGTTLVEQILASHPKVRAAGEIEAFQAILHELSGRTWMTPPRPWPRSGARR